MTTFIVDADEALRRADGFIDVTMAMDAPPEVLRYDLARMLLDTYAEGRRDGMKDSHALAIGQLDQAADSAVNTYAKAAGLKADEKRRQRRYKIAKAKSEAEEADA